MSLSGRHYVVQSEALRLQRELDSLRVQFLGEFHIDTDELFIIEEAVLRNRSNDVFLNSSLSRSCTLRLRLSCVVHTHIGRPGETSGVVVGVGAVVMHGLRDSRSLLFLHI